MDQNGDAIANEVLLARDKYTGPVLLLEGDGDEKLFRKFAADPEVLIIPTWGKQNAIDAVEILESSEAEGILAIVDADFSHLDGSFPISGNVLVTDDHDIEMMIIKTEAFSAVLRELGSSAKVKDFSTREERGVREVLLQKTLFVGHLRRLSLVDNLRLCFEGLRFEQFIDRNSLAVDVEALVTNVLALTRNRHLQTDSVQRRLLAMIGSANDDPYQICCGHDFVAILGIGLRKVLGTRSKEVVSPAVLGAMLRLAYDLESFHHTQLYRDATQWSNGNQGYAIFK